jgi:predicted phage terminase large subunit-like protein
MSRGAWLPFKYLVMISHIIATAIAMGGGRVMISVPPRHGKSFFMSQWVPAWFLANWPDKRVLLTTYEANFAATWGRRVRNIVREHGSDVGLYLAEDATASNNWATTQEGGMVTAGVGGPITGKGADLAIIDDPHKNWQETQSQTTREMIRDWFDSTFYTRLEPGATIVILHCMTGDTPVWMSDGTEKYLKDVRPGDMVATYRNGRLGVSKVENWINNGPDKVFTIKTTSGIVVKANERHPFLINEKGVAKWIRVKDLHLGHEIYRVNGESGKVSTARQSDATNQWPVEDTVVRTTIKSDGLMAFVHRQLMRCHALVTNLNTVMASLWNNTIECMRRRVGVVQFVSATLPWRTIHPVGGKYCASTTATIPGKSEDFFATTAISSVNDSLQPKCLKKPCDTSDFILEKIESITYAGIEDVFDVQITETENFIANGLPAHNTRWHEDDLIGYLLREKKNDGWFHIRIPAFAEDSMDPVGRKVGEALCPERYNAEALQRIKNNMPAMMWAALFQQRPAPMEGTIFLRHNWKYYKILPKCDFVLQSWDTASKKNKGSAYSVCQTWGWSELGAVLIDQWRDKVEYPQLRRRVDVEYLRYRPNLIIIEDRDTGQALLQSVQQETTYPVIGIYPDMDKQIRAQAVSPMQESRRVWLPEIGADTLWVSEFVDNCATFPNALYVDEVDAMSQALSYFMTMAIGGRIMSGEKRRVARILEGYRQLM